MRRVVGIDLGTQSVKVAVVAADGEVLSSASRPYAVDSRQAGWAETDPQAWLADVLARLPDMPMSRVHELLPWHWKAATELKRIAA